MIRRANSAVYALRWCILLLAVAIPASAIRTEFVAVRDGKRLTGAQACFFSGGPYENILASFFASHDIRCLPADDIVEMPATNWNIYCTHPSGFVSVHTTFQEGNGESAEQAAGYRRVEVTMVPAATLDLSLVIPSLHPEESLAVYFLNEGMGVFSAVQPLPSAHTTMLVPAGVTVVPIIVRGGLPRLAGTAVRLHKGETVLVEPISRRPAVIAAVRLLATSEEMQQLNALNAAAPHIVLVDSAGGEVQPLLAARPGATAHRSLCIFTAVKPGKYTVESRSPSWRIVPRQIVVTDKDSVVLDRDLELRAVTPVTVHWSIDSKLQDALAVTCPDEHSTRANVVRILQCGPDPRDCKTIYTEPLPSHPPFAGTITINTEFPDREHRATLALGGNFVGHRLTVQPYALNENHINFSAATVSGRVTSNGTAVAAEVQFGTGGSVSDALGRYTAVVEGDPKRSWVAVTPCGSTDEYRFQPETDVISGRVFDIDIPTQIVRVQVRAQDSGAPIASAGISAMSVDPTTQYENEFQTKRTDPAGRAELSHIGNRTVKVCAYASDYEHACKTEVHANDDVTLTLQRSKGRSGRVVTIAPIPAGRLYWVLPNGTVSEQLSVKPDGSFLYQLDHTSEEYCVFIGVRLPLYAFRPASDDVAAMTITLPAVAAADVTVALDPAATVTMGELGMRIGGLLVPNDAFNVHQQFHAEHAQLTKQVPVVVRSVALTGAIELLLVPVPYPAGVPVRGSGIDPFSIPQFAATFLRAAFTPGRPVVFR